MKHIMEYLGTLKRKWDERDEEELENQNWWAQQNEDEEFIEEMSCL